MPNTPSQDALTELEPDVAIQAEAILEHLNSNHPDTVLFLARHVLGAADLTDAELSSVDPAGAALTVTGPAGSRTSRIPFDPAVSTADDIRGRLIGELAAARAADPDGPLTSIEREIARQGSIPTRVSTVTAVSDVGPDLRQITFGGLEGHVPLGPDDFFLVILPRPGLEHQLDGDLSFQYFRDLPPDEAPAWAYYTVRRHRPEAGELDMWFVLHEHDGAVSGWARRARPGDRVALWGPRQAYEPPPDTTSVLLVGDETALGAFAAILEDGERSWPVTVVVECDGEQPAVELAPRSGDTVRWVDRGSAERGTGSGLLDALDGLDLELDGLYAYGAGESRQVTTLRNHLRRAHGLPASRVKMVGYWRRLGD